jgi:hypothetical protein
MDLSMFASSFDWKKEFGDIPYWLAAQWIQLQMQFEAMYGGGSRSTKASGGDGVNSVKKSGNSGTEETGGEHIIFIQRFWESDKSTISTFSIDNGKVTGYFLEPPRGTWEESITEGSKKRILAGEYHVYSVYSKNYKRQVMRFLDVSGRTDVLMHPGNKPGHSTACLLPGTDWRTDWVSSSGPKLDEILKYTGGNAKVIIMDPLWQFH